MTSFIINYFPLDMTCYQSHTIESFNFSRNTIKPYSLDNLKYLIDWIIKSTENGCVYTVDLSILLAFLLWNEELRPFYYTLTNLVWNHKLISLEDACKCSFSLRKWRSIFDVDGKIVELKDLEDTKHRWEQWLLLDEFQNSIEKDKFFGIPYETLGKTAAKILQWKGAKVNSSLLEKGLDFFRSSSTRLLGKNLTLFTHYEATSRMMRQDGYIHPHYEHLRTHRLGAMDPQVQTFTENDDDYPSRALITKDSDDEILLSLDLKMAELFALGVILSEKKEFSHPTKLLDDLNTGVDLHIKVGKSLLPNTDCEITDLRDVGKLFNYAFLNMSSLHTINASLKSKNLPIITYENYNKTRQELYDTYGIKSFHDDAKNRSYPTILTCIHGRVCPVHSSNQYTGFQFQTVAGDASALGVIKLAENGYFPNVLVHDEVVISCKIREVPSIISCYREGVGMLYRNANFETKITIYPSMWGVKGKVYTHQIYEEEISCVLDWKI